MNVSDKKRAAIQSLYWSGVPLAAVAREYHLNSAAVWAIAHDKDRNEPQDERKDEPQDDRKDMVT